MSRRFAQSVKLIVLIIGAFVMMFPFVWMLATSLKTLPESVAIPPILLPDTPQWSNYAEALRTAPFGLYFRNSILVAGLGTLLTLILTVLAAYAFTIYEFRGKTVFFFLCLATMMVPSELLIIQNFITISRLHWVNTFQGMIVPTLASGFYIYMIREYFMKVPSVLYRAAKVDGCGDLRYLLRVMIPMNKNAIATIGILTFISQWNSFIWPLMVSKDDAYRPAAFPGRSQLSGQSADGRRHHRPAAHAAVLSGIPQADHRRRFPGRHQRLTAWLQGGHAQYSNTFRKPSFTGGAFL